MEKTTGFCTRTFRFRLYCNQEEWLLQTKKIYNEVLQFYYEILLQEQELKAGNTMELMRQLEILSVGTKKS